MRGVPKENVYFRLISEIPTNEEILLRLIKCVLFFFVPSTSLDRNVNVTFRNVTFRTISRGHMLDEKEKVKRNIVKRRKRKRTWKKGTTITLRPPFLRAVVFFEAVRIFCLFVFFLISPRQKCEKNTT